MGETADIIDIKQKIIMTAAYKLSLTTFFAISVLFMYAPFVHASSVVWNTTISGGVGVCDGSCPFNANDYGFNNPNISVEYRAFIKNADTGEIIPPGGTVPVGTNLDLVFDKHVSEDISWFATGGYMDSPYGDWGDPDTQPPATCADKDYLNSSQDITQPATLYYKNHVSFIVHVPTQQLDGVNALLSCGSFDGSAQPCTAVAQGDVPVSFNLDTTVGKFYAQFSSWGPYITSRGGVEGKCSLIYGVMTIKAGGHWPPWGAYSPWPIFLRSSANSADHVDVGTEFIPYPITIVPASTTGPTRPTISVDNACTTGSAFTLSFTSTDLQGHQLKYGVDWDNDGTVDQFVPPSGYVNSGVVQTASRTYSTSGEKTIRVIAINDQGAQSLWATKTFSCQNEVTACPSGYVQQGNQCVLSNQCTTPPRCSGNDLVNSCTGETIQSGACNPPPELSATFKAVPSLLHIGATTNRHVDERKCLFLHRRGQQRRLLVRHIV